MASLSMLAQSRAVAPPGRRERALTSAGSIPVVACSRCAEWRRALVMNVGVMRYQLFLVGWLLKCM